MSFTLPKISVVIITYNRIEMLRRTIQSFIDNTEYPRDFMQIICTDDCSDDSVQDEIRTLPIDKFVTGKKRSGLSSNVNRGLNAADHALILQIQDDWECVGPRDYLSRAVKAFLQNKEIGAILLRNHPNNLRFKDTFKQENDVICIHQNNPEKNIQKVGQHAYTDWPHLKSRTFIECIGPYNEKLAMWDAELDYSRRVNAQKSQFIAEIEGLNAFKHIGGDHSFNTGPLRARIFKKIRILPGASRTLDFIKRIQQQAISVKNDFLDRYND